MAKIYDKYIIFYILKNIEVMDICYAVKKNIFYV